MRTRNLLALLLLGLTLIVPSVVEAGYCYFPNGTYRQIGSPNSIAGTDQDIWQCEKDGGSLYVLRGPPGNKAEVKSGKLWRKAKELADRQEGCGYSPEPLPPPKARKTTTCGR